MQWIDGFERLDGEPHLAVVSLNGERGLTPFKQLRRVAPQARGSRYVSLPGVALNAFSECEPEQFLDLSGFEAHVSPNHRVYELETPNARLLIPAAVMMLGLFARIWHLAPWLTAAATLDRLAVPSFDSEVPTVTFFPGSISGGRDTECTQERFLWLTSFPSARQMWNSVANNVGAGRLALSMPKALIEGSASGLSRGDTVLVNRLHVNRITPLESPVPCASVLTGRSFQVSSRTDQISTRRPDTLADETLPSQAGGWHLTDKEWAEVTKVLDARSMATARPRIDEILLKLGTGRAWDDINRKLDARALYFRFKRQGRWERIRNLLVASRRA